MFRCLAVIRVPGCVLQECGGERGGPPSHLSLTKSKCQAVKAKAVRFCVATVSRHCSEMDDFATTRSHVPCFCVPAQSLSGVRAGSVQSIVLTCDRAWMWYEGKEDAEAAATTAPAVHAGIGDVDLIEIVCHFASDME